MHKFDILLLCLVWSVTTQNVVSGFSTRKIIPGVRGHKWALTTFIIYVIIVDIKSSLLLKGFMVRGFNGVYPKAIPLVENFQM